MRHASGIVIAVLVGVTLLVHAGDAPAEVGIGPPVVAWLPLNAPLTNPVETIVSLDDPEQPTDATITARVVSAGQELATLGPYTIQLPGPPQRLSMALPASAVTAIADIRRRQPHALGTVMARPVISGCAA